MKRTRFDRTVDDSHSNNDSASEDTPSLLTSRSTPSLPALVNYALLATLSKRPQSMTMHRGSSQQASSPIPERSAFGST
ncbi:phosphatidylinositol n-acetylglucosaminyltransferase subunit p isoform e [Lichtheimia corymbifera JMRC:FSU:9682]|uniref:Phosphatidylinositol n-acetylglucosaminyltransferase subunit p isoform e n=1 Tax=Lichtheimia corymbifera JMRC:FSU:9682 TaxID=1263082 RepID=A0A068RYB3_9FUNG|nr:phosphatidylinositol n-acetylglucosaminyltransferase subunit p isoform e [Lichtheimia corymbifera JMRC:FSU:9682]